MAFQRFWMVLGSGTPVVRHPTLEQARKEAERLARQDSGQSFYVLEAVGHCVKSDVRWDQPDDDLGDGFPPF